MEFDKDIERLLKYKQYLNTIQAMLDKYFEEQKDYVFCKKGCSYCCEKGQYPYSEIEFAYLKIGFLELAKEEQLKIQNRVYTIKEDYKNRDLSKDFFYRCPFLSDKGECTVYEYRGLICRNFGIMHINPENKVTMPFCEDLGLNYSNVYDDEKRKLDFDLIKKLGYAHPPKPYPITRLMLMDKDIFEGEPLNFGESKFLLDWL